MVKSDLYIHGTDADLNAVKRMVVSLAERIGCDTSDESALNIPLSIVMQVLIGAPMHLGLLIGMNTEDPECVVLRIETGDIVDVYDALLECFSALEIEVDEDVDDVPWPCE